MTDGVSIVLEPRRGEASLFRQAYRALCGLLLYAALWGGLGSMAYLSTAGLPQLSAGGVFVLALALTPRRRWAVPALLGGGALLAALLILARRDVVLDGCKYLLNRLFAASAERQAYVYDSFAVTAPDGLAALRWALVPLGIASGLVCGLAARYRAGWLYAALFAAFCAGAAWLGVSPAAGWSAALLCAALLPFLEASEGGAGSGAMLLAAALACAAVFLAFPGEDTRLSAWDEAARDYLAYETVAYTDRAQYEAARRDERAADTKQFYQAEETAADTGGEGDAFPVPIFILLAILITAVLLFVPAIYSDRLRKRRAKNRAGLDDADPAAGTRAAFLCAMRWLAAGGMDLGNRPYGERAGEVEDAYGPALRAQFDAALPLWREAAYSEHPLGEADRAAMLAFLEDVKRAVWGRLGRRARLRVKYIEAL